METSLLITLMGRIYEGKLPLFATETELEEIQEETEQFQFSSQLYHLIRSRGLQEQLPAPFLQRLKQQADAVLFQSMLIRGETNKLLRKFEESGIDAILLKGIRLSERYFGHFAARTTTDIDLLVKPEQLAAAHALLEKERFMKQEDEDDDAHFHSLYNKVLDNPMYPFIGVELHWNVMRTHISDTDADACWRDASPLHGYTHIKEMSEQETFYHLCLHGYNHDMMSIKHLHDVAHLVAEIGERIDYPAIFRQARQDGNYAKLMLVLSLVYRLLPGLPAKKPFPGLRRWPFWSVRLMRDRVWGRKGWRYYAFRFMTALVSHDTFRHRMAHLRYLFFPPSDFASHQLADNRKASAVRLYARIYRNRLRMWLRPGGSKSKPGSRSRQGQIHGDH